MLKKTNIKKIQNFSIICKASNIQSSAATSMHIIVIAYGNNTWTYTQGMQKSAVASPAPLPHLLLFKYLKTVRYNLKYQETNRKKSRKEQNFNTDGLVTQA